MNLWKRGLKLEIDLNPAKLYYLIATLSPFSLDTPSYTVLFSSI